MKDHFVDVNKMVDRRISSHELDPENCFNESIIATVSQEFQAAKPRLVDRARAQASHHT